MLPSFLSPSLSLYFASRLRRCSNSISLKFNINHIIRDEQRRRIFQFLNDNDRHHRAHCGVHLRGQLDGKQTRIFCGIQFHYIHETGVGILIGLVFGVIAWEIQQKDVFSFSQEIFFYGLLPPMIFAGGYNLKKKKFFQNFTYISLYGVIGTIVTFGIIFGLTYAINELGWILRLSDSATITLSLSLMIKYSATICASDSVAALTMIKPTKYPKLFSIVFGEGMINDAVAIILFKVVGDIFDHESDKSTAFLLLDILWKFIVNVLVSLLIGVVFALGCSKLFQVSRFLSHNAVAEVSILFMTGIMSYMLAQILQMSGVITVLVCGVCLAHFNFYNLSVTGQLSSGVTFQFISFVAEAFVFIYLGISCMNYVKNYPFSITFVSLQLFICAFARFSTIFGLSYFSKLFKKQWKVSFYELLIISFAGVIRGSVAFALILTIGGQKGTQQQKILQTSVMLMVFITTITLGAAMPFFITQCLKRDTTQLQGRESLIPQENKPHKPPKGFKKFDEEFLKPFFIFQYAKRKKEIQQHKKLLKTNSPDYKGGQFTGLYEANLRQSTAIDAGMVLGNQKTVYEKQEQNISEDD